jgi:hypothetical protein
MPLGNSSQWWRFEFQYSRPGPGKSGAPKQPTETHKMSGNASNRVKTVTPHVGQKFDSCQRPASDERRQHFASPPIVAADSGKNAEYENALPVLR